VIRHQIGNETFVTQPAEKIGGVEIKGKKMPANRLPKR